MEQMIDEHIKQHGLERALRLEWVLLAFNETNESDRYFEEAFKIQKEAA